MAKKHKSITVTDEVEQKLRNRLEKLKLEYGVGSMSSLIEHLLRMETQDNETLRLRLQHQHDIEIRKLEFDIKQRAKDREDQMVLALISKLEDKMKQTPDDPIARLMIMQLVQKLSNQTPVSDPTQTMIKTLMTMEMIKSLNPKLTCAGCSYSTTNEQEFVEHVENLCEVWQNQQLLSWVEKGAECPICRTTGKSEEWKRFSDWRSHVLMHKKDGQVNQ